MKCKWQDISKYRGELFGIAIVSVIILHYLGILRAGETNRVVYLFARLYNGAVGSVGVDIFVFLSGYGICYSLCRGKTLREFYLKRFHRVVFPYLVLGMVFWIIKDLIILREPFSKFIYDYSLLSFWFSGVQSFWYIAFICLMYILSPLFFRLTDDRRKVIIGIAVSCAINVICYLVSPQYFDKIEIALQRLPGYMLGMYCGKLSKSPKAEQEISGKLMVFLMLSIPVKIAVGLMNHPLARLFNGYYAVFLIAAYTAMRNRMAGAQNRLFKALSMVGAYSLELYVVHIAVRNLMGTLEFNLQNPLIYLLHLAIVIPIVRCFVMLQKVKLFNET